MRQYTVIYEPGKRNWSAYVPDLPGCIATGKTRKQVEKLICGAIEIHIAGLKAHGEKVPEPKVHAGTVDVASRNDRDKTLAAVREGLADVVASRNKPARAALNRLAKKHGIPIADN